MIEFTTGESVVIIGNFTDQNGDPVNPDTVVLSVRAPDGTITTPSFTNPSVGEYEAPVTLNQDGKWRWQWTGTTGSNVAIDEGVVCAKKSTVVYT